MPDVLQLRGDTTSAHGSFTGTTREVTVDTDKNAVVVHDGGTAGGHPQALEEDLTTHTGNAANPHAVTAAQVGAPPTARQVAAGAGLTGGGKLTADRTIGQAPHTVVTAAHTAVPMTPVLADTSGGRFHPHPAGDPQRR